MTKRRLASLYIATFFACFITSVLIVFIREEVITLTTLFTGIMLYGIISLALCTPGMMFSYILLISGYGRTVRFLPTIFFTVIVANISVLIFIWSDMFYIPTLHGFLAGLFYYLQERTAPVVHPIIEVASRLTPEQIRALTPDQIAEIRKVLPEWNPPSF